MTSFWKVSRRIRVESCKKAFSLRYSLVIQLHDRKYEYTENVTQPNYKIRFLQRIDEYL